MQRLGGQKFVLFPLVGNCGKYQFSFKIRGLKFSTFIWTLTLDVNDPNQS